MLYRAIGKIHLKNLNVERMIFLPNRNNREENNKLHLGSGFSFANSNWYCNCLLTIIRDVFIRETILMTVCPTLQNRRFCIIYKNGCFVTFNIGGFVRLPFEIEIVKVSNSASELERSLIVVRKNVTGVKLVKLRKSYIRKQYVRFPYGLEASQLNTPHISA